MVSVGLLCLGFLLLIKGADFFVDGAGTIASYLKIPSVIIGLTIVAFGTSAPEAAVSVTAALNNSNAIALSNVVGSNIFNLVAVLGVTALLSPLVLTKSIMRREYVVLIVASIVLLGMILFDLTLSRLDGVILLVGIVAYVLWLIYDALQKRATVPAEKVKLKPVTAIFLLLIGIAGIMFGADFVVKGSKEIALELGMSEKLIGLTIVSIGTSLPELVTSVVAARKGEADIALGNVVGSNIFNVLFILGLSSSITPIAVDPSLITDMIVMIGITLFVYGLGRLFPTFKKSQGLLLLSIFIIYTVFIIIRN